MQFYGTRSYHTHQRTLRDVHCIIHSNNNYTIFFSHSLLALIRNSIMKEKRQGGEVVIMLPSPYIGSGCVANEMDYSEDMLLIQW